MPPSDTKFIRKHLTLAIIVFISNFFNTSEPFFMDF